MATSLALPSSTGTTADAQPSQLPKQPAQPALPKPPSAAPPLALAGSMGGQASTQMSPVPVPQTADPLAFAVGSTMQAPPSAGMSIAPGAPTPAAPPAVAQVPTATPTMSTAEFGAYSPIQAATAGLTGAAKEKAITDYWAGQGTQGLSGVGGNSFGANGAYDPAANAAATAAYKANNPPAIDEITKAVTGGQAGALGAYEAGNDAIRAQTRSDDFDTQTAANEALGGVYPDKEKARAEYLAGTPITPQAGTQLGDKTTVVPGFGETTRPILPQDRPGTSGTPQDTATAIANQATGGQPTGGNNVALSEINPEDSLISKQITPGQNIDRVKIAQDALNSTRTNVLDPARAAAARDLNRYNFGAGRGVSGQARTSQGDLADSYDRRLADMSAQAIADATRGSIDDNYRNIDETQQERDYQTGRADTAFDQDAQLALIREQLTNGAFGRADRQQQAGYANGPEDIGLILSKIFGDQSSAAGKAAAESFRNAGSSGGNSSQGGGGSYDDILKLIEAYRNRGGSQTPVQSGVDTPVYDGREVA